jgi:hypothetical protein
MAYEDLDDYSVGAAGSDTFDVVIPDLDPSTAYPIQFRWQFADKTVGLWSVSKILNTPEIARPEATNIVAVWVGTSLKVTWDAPALASSFQIYLTAGATTMSWSKAIDKSQTQQTFILSKEDNKANFGGVFQTTLTGVLKTTYIDNNTDGAAFAIPPYVDALCSAAVADTDWTLTSISNGFTVAWTANSSIYPTYDYTEVYVSDSATGTYTREYAGKGPATIKVTTFANNYVKIKHISEANCSSAFSTVKIVTAYDPIVTDIIPPDEVTGISAVWSGDDIAISFNFPASNPGKRFRVFLTNGGQTVFFDKYTTDTSSPASIKILSAELFGGFGDYYTSFTGVLSSVDEYENKTTGVSFAVAEKTNPLSAITPTATATPMSNGYTVTWTLPAGASYAKVYQGATSGFTPNDSTNLVYSGQSPAVVISLDYTETFVKIKYFNNFGSSSLSSTAYSVTPLDAGMLSVIDNPVEVRTGGSILAGDAITSGARLLLNETGIYLYDKSAIVGTGPTTQIIGNATSGSPTFITTNAKIANWNIYSTKIENSLVPGSITKFAGLSPSGTYAFWAGSTTAGGDASAKFTVDQLGQLTARDIKIVGGELTVGGDGTYANSPFAVNTSGVFKATDATISGTVNATAGTFTGTVNIGSSTVNGQLALYAGANKFEIGRLKDVNGAWLNDIGIQGTNAGSRYFQLDTVNGIIVEKGTIGGWTVNSTTISKNYTSLNADGSITAGSGGEFTVSAAGALAATGATISGTIRASQGGFGTFSGATLTKGWTITSPSIVSTAAGANQITLNGETGVISGGTISGTKIIGSAFYIGASDTATDYFKSDGSFRFAGGKIYGTSSSLTIAAGTNIQMNIASNDDGTAGDNTVNQASNGSLTLGRAFFYGSNYNPQTGNGGSRFDNRYDFYLASGSYQGVADFGPGDIWMQRE